MACGSAEISFGLVEKRPDQCAAAQGVPGVKRVSGAEQFPDYLQIKVSMEIVRFEMTSFAPFVPRIDEYELFVRRKHVARSFHGLLQEKFEYSRIVVDERDG
jgi:hypothetical protein